MDRARSHRRLAGSARSPCSRSSPKSPGRSLTVSLDLGRHVPTPSYAGADYYPFLLAGVKIALALMLAALTWRFIKARAAARAARRLLAACRCAGRTTRRGSASSSRCAAGRSRTGSTAGIYLVQTDSERFAAGRWPLMSPWLHTSALSVFAVLSVLVALLYGAVVALALRLRALRETPPPRPLAPARAPVVAAPHVRADSTRLAASSASPSSLGLLPPRRKPRAHARASRRLGRRSMSTHTATHRRPRRESRTHEQRTLLSAARTADRARRASSGRSCSRGA